MELNNNSGSLKKILLISGVVLVIIGIVSLSVYYGTKSSSSSSPLVTYSPTTPGATLPQEPYVGKFYPPIDFEASNVYRLKPESGEGWAFNRTYVKGQSYGNGQYDMAMSSCWYSLTTTRNVWNIFNKDQNGWLSGGGYISATGSNLGMPTGQNKTTLVDESNINGEWVQVSFPQDMDFNGIQLKQTFAGYPIIVNLAIVAGNDTSLVNAPIWLEQSPIGPQPTPTPTFPVVPSPVPVKNNFNQTSRWTKLIEFTNLDPTPLKVLNLSFPNSTKYRTYRLIVTKTSGEYSSATIDYVKFVKN